MVCVLHGSQVRIAEANTSSHLIVSVDEVCRQCLEVRRPRVTCELDVPKAGISKQRGVGDFFSCATRGVRVRLFCVVVVVVILELFSGGPWIISA